MTCFQNFRNTLEEVFSATVQSEDELNYPSATLIIAGLLQLYARTPRYASHRARLQSFRRHTESLDAPRRAPLNGSDRTRATSPRPSASELASAGFFHTGSGDETVCPACGLGLRDWQATDQPEACHLAYSTAEVKLRIAGDGIDLKPNPALPCLYIAVHRLLTSELPLARKSLVPAGRVQPMCALPGVVSRPSFNSISGESRENSKEFASLSDRLRAIARIMASPPAPQGWPVENARALGHSDDLIVLALWRLQAESVGLGLACPSMSQLRLDPQATVDVLRAILHLQEEFDTTSGELPTFDIGGSVDCLEEANEMELTAEDAETAALSRCCYERIQQVQPVNDTLCLSAETTEFDSKSIRLPQLSQYISWWSSKWPVEK